jgi:hypothetical protein
MVDHGADDYPGANQNRRLIQQRQVMAVPNAVRNFVCREAAGRGGSLRGTSSRRRSPYAETSVSSLQQSSYDPSSARRQLVGKITIIRLPV